MRRKRVWRFIYFAEHQTGSRLKIGCSRNPFRRVHKLKSKILGILPMQRLGYWYKEELAVHRKFKAHHIGHEWYRDVPQIRVFIFESGAHGNLWDFHKLFLMYPPRKYKAAAKEGSE